VSGETPRVREADGALMFEIGSILDHEVVAIDL
jgi:hypothetical protein